jgi:hypothetical protein
MMRPLSWIPGKVGLNTSKGATDSWRLQREENLKPFAAARTGLFIDNH